MTHARALAARRAAIASAALGSAVAAHVVSMGGWDVLPVAPALWAMAVATAALVGARNRAFRPRGIAVTTLLVLVMQMVCHAAMTAAPWAFGLRVHHEMPIVTPSAALAHVAAGLVLVACVVWLERVLAAATRVVRAVVALVRGARARSRIAVPPPRTGTACGRVRVPTAAFLVVAPSRGPPLPA